MTITVFSLNVSSAGKGPFKAGKVKNMHQRCTFLEATENIRIVDVVHNMKLYIMLSISIKPILREKFHFISFHFTLKLFSLLTKLQGGLFAPPDLFLSGLF